MAQGVLPKEPGRFLTGNLKEILDNPLLFLSEKYAINNEISRSKAGPIDVYNVGNPDLIKTILTDKKIEKARLNRKLFYPVIGNGLLASEGELWKQQRRSISSIFRPKKVVNLQQQMIEPSEKLAEKLADSGKVNLTEAATLVTIQILVRTIFGLQHDFPIRNLDENLSILADQFVKRVSSVIQIPLWIPTKQNRTLNDSTTQVLEIVQSLIDEHDKIPDELNQNSLITALRSAEDENANKMSTKQIFDEVATFFLAGHEATSTTLQWAVFNLSRHTEKQKNLQMELDTVLGDCPPQKDDFDKLPYLKAVVDETLRLFPTCYVQTREVAHKDYELNGIKLKKGSLIAIPVYAIHRNPKWYRNPDDFLPERWLDSSLSELPKLAYMPFGGGKRVCIGEHFSRFELMTLLSIIYQKTQSNIIENETAPNIFPAVTLRPDKDMYVAFRKRS